MWQLLSGKWPQFPFCFIRMLRTFVFISGCFGEFTNSNHFAAAKRTCTLSFASRHVGLWRPSRRHASKRHWCPLLLINLYAQSFIADNFFYRCQVMMSKTWNFSVFRDEPNGTGRIFIRHRLLQFAFWWILFLWKLVFWTFEGFFSWLWTSNSASRRAFKLSRA